MICHISLLLKGTPFIGGDSVLLRIEGISEPKNVIGKLIRIQIFDVDMKSGTGPNTTPELLAEFTSIILKDSGKNKFYFDSSQINRIDSFDRALPGPYVLKDGNEKALPDLVDYKPAHFLFCFQLKNGEWPSQNQRHIILFRGHAKKREHYLYEIGVKIKLDNEIISDLSETTICLDCTNLLAENCSNVTKGILLNHSDLVMTRKVGNRNIGTRFGNKYHYIYPDAEAFISDARIHDSAIRDQIKHLWSESERKQFEEDKKTYGLLVTSCIGYALEVLRLGHELTGLEADWKKINRFVIEGKGQSLVAGLINAGWRSIYYNPDTVHAYDKDSEHPYSFKQAKKNKKYGNEEYPPIVSVFDFAINYSPTKEYNDGVAPSSLTPVEGTIIAQLEKVPLGFIIGRGGKHTALLINGKIFEAHWDKGPYEKNVFTGKRDLKFNPDNIENSWDWLSGLIVVPRFYWPKALYRF